MLNSANTHHESLSGGHLAFLRRVTEDDRFRTALETDPRATMAEYGIQVEAGQVPSEVSIPSVESILDVLIDTNDEEDSLATKRWFGLLGS